MKTWSWALLFILVGIVLLHAFSYREGVNETLAPTPTCSTPGIDIIDGVCKKPNVPSIAPVCPAGSTLSVGKCRGGDSITAAEAAAVGLTYDSFLNQYTKPAVPTCPAGYTKSLTGAEGECEDVNASAPVCSSGYVYDRGSCILPTAGGGSSITPETTGTTSGSDLSRPPNSALAAAPATGTMGDSGLFRASGGNKRNVFGPAFVGFGDNAGLGVGGGGSRQYPSLIGPKPKESTMVEGGGIFRTSKVPGDQDLIPNPYLEFTPSTGSAKTEPVPFLSDFSAFAK